MKRRRIVGKRFGKWLVLKKENSDAHYRSRFLCRCDCGIEKITLGQGLLNGESTSCGHDRAEIHTTHGERQNRTPEYAAWTAMKQRCLNTKCHAYKDWGRRGIKVCQQWVESYEQFLSDVGRRPSAAHSLGRMENNGNYTPDNVRWEVQVEQHNNKRSNRVIRFNGQERTLAQWAVVVGISGGNLSRRLANWPISKALTLPPNSKVLPVGRPRLRQG